MASSNWKEKVVNDWSCYDISCWLRSIDQASIAKKFRKQQIDGKALALLQKQDVKEILENDSVGTRVKVWNEIEKLRLTKQKRRNVRSRRNTNKTKNNSNSNSNSTNSNSTNSNSNRNSNSNSNSSDSISIIMRSNSRQDNYYVSKDNNNDNNFVGISIKQSHEPRRAHTRWSKDEEEQMLIDYQNGVTIDNLSNKYQRSRKAIRGRIAKIKEEMRANGNNNNGNNNNSENESNIDMANRMTTPEMFDRADQIKDRISPLRRNGPQSRQSRSKNRYSRSNSNGNVNRTSKSRSISFKEQSKTHYFRLKEKKWKKNHLKKKK